MTTGQLRDYTDPDGNNADEDITKRDNTVSMRARGHADSGLMTAGCQETVIEVVLIHIATAGYLRLE